LFTFGLSFSIRAVSLLTFKEGSSSGGPPDLHRPHPKSIALNRIVNSLPRPAKAKEKPAAADQQGHRRTKSPAFPPGESQVYIQFNAGNQNEKRSGRLCSL